MKGIVIWTRSVQSGYKNLAQNSNLKMITILRGVPEGVIERN